MLFGLSQHVICPLSCQGHNFHTEFVVNQQLQIPFCKAALQPLHFQLILVPNVAVFQMQNLACFLLYIFYIFLQNVNLSGWKNFILFQIFSQHNIQEFIYCIKPSILPIITKVCEEEVPNTYKQDVLQLSLALMHLADVQVVDKGVFTIWLDLSHCKE